MFLVCFCVDVWIFGYMVFMKVAFDEVKSAEGFACVASRAGCLDGEDPVLKAGPNGEEAGSWGFAFGFFSPEMHPALYARA